MVVEAVALGHVVLDDIHRADGTETVGVLGGAGTYAALGQAMVSTRTAIVSGVGRDFPAAARRRFTDASIDTSALLALDAHTPRTIIHYHADGERTETSAHGDAHFSALDPRWELLGPALRQAQGYYVFDAINPELWEHLAKARRTHHSKVLWEIRADICTPGHFDSIRAQLQDVDCLSINRTEIRSLCASDDLVECLSMVAATGIETITLRLGAQGALVVNGNDVFQARTQVMHATDPTGGGNSFSGAFLAQWVSSNDLEYALRSAMAAAELTIRQVGPPTVNDTTRAELQYLAASCLTFHTPFDHIKENGLPL